ncbi:unnamed protein product [Prunus armeniaca]|uniref:Strictosidine synthase conserved region domain-containing protein n=1 Tax=Prunus armeniaca TaxID=36596 RepID=A0A6J5W0M8_PRUAR|nr:unnamed protein product [Prunus armeniaca]CAB4294033.1 unnamed protein product [Prunus armeniaca]
MEKKKLLLLRDKALLQHPILLLLVLVLGFVVMDPLQMGPLGDREYRPVKHNIAPYKQVMERWPRDNESRLGFGKLEFEDQVFGPESLEFDALGGGPYTGLADGRIVRWMGSDLGWETFALWMWALKGQSRFVLTALTQPHTSNGSMRRSVAVHLA